MDFDFITIEPRVDGFVVYGHGVYPEGSVLEGQPRRCFLDSFDTLAEATDAWPFAEVCDHSTKIEPINDSLEALSGLSSTPPDWFDPSDAGEEW